MKLVQRWLDGVVQIFNVLTLNTFSDGGALQQPLAEYDALLGSKGDYPIFHPPTAPSEFKCRYPSMKGWGSCTGPNSRDCWLRGPNGEQTDIHTNYEKEWPKGRTRRYHLNVTAMHLAPDGFINTEGKVFNKTYPGPWIQACWGDEIEITVTNYLPHNGTTIHWHGIRQHYTVEMDGVNGVTQCPIATNETFTYKFKAMQYGFSWYHSHYSLQYADGLLGPLTIYGPASADYDYGLDPLLMTDWNHRSAFQDFYKELSVSGPPEMTSILLNGRGTFDCTGMEQNCTKAPDMYEQVVQRGKRYLLRLINTSVDSTFIFSIDNHNITVIGSDFVPIKPYTTNAVLIGIGQRYHVVVTMNDTTQPSQNYWIRTTPADGCNGFDDDNPVDERTGILRYAESEEKPTTTAHKFANDCSDEPYESLIPIIPWEVGNPANPQASASFEAGLTQYEGTELPHGNASRWDLGTNPLWLNFSDPTVLNVNYTRTNPHKWKDELVVVPESYTENDWVYLLITASGLPYRNTKRRFVPVAHPIHLHGHDFALLAQSTTPYWGELARLKTKNPPRRDVALLPKSGYIVIAFKADNPGAWLLHCHIAWHASSGLALQILERQPDLNKNLTAERLRPIREGCKTWHRWFANPDNYWDHLTKENFQDDSGI